MRFVSDSQRRAVFSRLNGSCSRFSELPDWAKKYTETPISHALQTRISNEPVIDLNKNFEALPYDKRRFYITEYIKEHPEIKENISTDNITLFNVLNDFAMENGIDALDEIDWSQVETAGSFNDMRTSIGLARKKKFEQTRLSRHLKEIGSVWIGGDYVHGPRIRQPEEFEFIKNVEPSPKFFHFEGADKVPKRLPEGSKLVVGKLKSGEWAVQSTIIPKTSKLGRSLMAK